MPKDAYYFSHDSNAKDDPKCVLLIEQLGLEGYGIYWVLIETLRDQPDYKYPIVLIGALARRYNTTSEKMKAVVNGYGLFTVDENDFFSLSLIRRMEHLDYKRELARIAGKKSAEKRLQLASGSTDVQPTFNEGSTSKVNESKVNEIKEDIHIPFKEIVEHLNIKTGSKYKHNTNKTQDSIKARWNEGFRLDDFKKVIDIKTAEWLNTDMAKFLRPETLFGNKFEGYLNQKLGQQKPQQTPVKNFTERQYDANSLEAQLLARGKRDLG
jgi:uncharacterized phage protein (TIGR02220 family)